MSIVLTPEGTPASPVEGELYYDSTANEIKVRVNNEFKDVSTAFLQGEPHIIPGVLYPAVSGKLLDGSTSHSGNYGTAQSDGRSYYYTDIKGSKPIKDPRIGGHFGSQRHKFKSTQLLDQETATHGQDVYSIDGREWARATAPNGKLTHFHRYDGQWFRVHQTTDAFYEITGYFSAVNILGSQWNGTVRDLSITVDGSVTNANFQEMSASIRSPLADHDNNNGRFVDASSVFSVATGLTLGIHTIKIAPQSSSDYADIFGIELIAQNTTSTANRSKIQIPSQDVVSYGKKFTVSAEGSSGHHYDPFNGFTYGSSVSSYVDTATSLGLDKWLHSSNYYRPYNGMRVIKWVDENGTIKTSVTCMPPNAKSIADSSSLTNATAKANASASNNTFYPTFEAHTTDVNEDNLHEVAKTFYAREFGNGSANGNSSYADASTLSGNDAIAYVMDDGLTSFSSDEIERNSSHLSLTLWSGNDFIYITFIGTGITVSGDEFFGTRTIAQNLPYGTHILKIVRDSNGKSVYSLDGVSIFTSSETNYGEVLKVTFYQPKKPPIPEDSVILADYMLLADFVVKAGVGPEYTSKGVLRKDASRDFFYDGSTATLSFNHSGGSSGFFVETGNSSGGTSADRHATLPSFGTNFTLTGYNVQSRMDLDLNGSTATYTNVNTGSAHGTFAHLTNNTTLGINKFKVKNKANERLSFGHFEVATPIHTSHHYQSFESKFLHELIGGDRNMEQTNLVCSPDGKTWDEVTRDVSYIGNNVLSLGRTNNTAANTTSTWILDDCRGQHENKDFYNKFFAIAYDRVICLQDGSYRIIISVHYSTEHVVLLLNGSELHRIHNMDAGYGAGSTQIAKHLKKGDYLQITGGYSASTDNWRYTNFQIEKL